MAPPTMEMGHFSVVVGQDIIGVRLLEEEQHCGTSGGRDSVHKRRRNPRNDYLHRCSAVGGIAFGGSAAIVTEGPPTNPTLIDSVSKKGNRWTSS